VTKIKQDSTTVSSPINADTLNKQLTKIQ